MSRIFPKQFTVQVTQEDIDKGQEGNCYKCPVARAVKRFLKTNKRLLVRSNGSLRIPIGVKQVNSVELYIFDTYQSKCELFVKKFDSGLKVRPTKFTFRLLKDV